MDSGLSCIKKKKKSGAEVKLPDKLKTLLTFQFRESIFGWMSRPKSAAALPLL